MDATQVEDESASPAQPSDHLEVVSPDAPAVPQRPPRLLSLTINAFIAVLAVATALLVFATPLHGEVALRQPIPQPLMLVIVAALWAAAVLSPISLHYRGHTFGMLLDTVPMILGLAFLAPTLLVLAAVCAETAVHAVVYRKSLVKVAFNMVTCGLGVAVTLVVFRELLGNQSPVSLRGWVATGAALCATTVVSGLAVGGVVKLHGQTPERRTGFELTIQAMLTAASICLALVVLNAAWINLWTILPVLLMAVLIVGAYRGYMRLSLRFASLQRLYDFSQALGIASLDPSSMGLDVLKQVCTVMRARRAELVLAEPSGIPRRISLNESNLSGVEPISLHTDSIVTQAIRSGVAALHRDATQHGSASFDPIVGTYHDAVVAPLMNGRVATGAIVVLDRDEEFDTFDNDDLRLFETLVANASANLERARLVEELRFEVESKTHQATHDSLTNLPNRTLFLSRAASALSQSSGVAVVLLDIDRFKDVNDTLGHAIGDSLLVEISERLSRVVPQEVTVARLGGDEFAFVVPDVITPEPAVNFMQALHNELSRPIKMDGLALAVTASAGIALAPAHGDDVALLLQRADIAMYVAKARRSSTEVYSVELDQSMHRRLLLGGLLTNALEKGDELRLVYQPIADAGSRQIVQVEALARWHHPEHGPIPPEEFIGIAEQMGLISQITDFVLAEGCSQLARWRDAGMSINLAINVSGREFADIGLVDRVERYLKAYDLPPELLTLEVTETEIMADLTAATKVLDALAAMGVLIGIDDYGTGYSSLAYLHRLPVQKLKIDRSFITNLPSDLSNAIIVRSSIAMAHSLGLTVVAEGVEDEVACAMLADAECDFIQGYYLSKPMEPADLQDWVLSGASLQFGALGGATTAPPSPSPAPDPSRVSHRSRPPRLAVADRHH